MSEQYPSTIGSVAQEAARLIEDMATMARSTYSGGDEPSPYADGAPAEPGWPDAEYPAFPVEDDEAGGSGTGAHQAGSHRAKDEPPEGACSLCGAEGDDARRDDTPSSCRLCPLCRGIAALRSVRPETVDMLADLALSVAAGLRDVAMRSRASDSDSSARQASARSTSARSTSARPPSGAPPDAERSSVQDIPVDDESEEGPL